MVLKRKGAEAQREKVFGFRRAGVTARFFRQAGAVSGILSEQRSCPANIGHAMLKNGRTPYGAFVDGSPKPEQPAEEEAWLENPR